MADDKLARTAADGDQSVPAAAEQIAVSNAITTNRLQLHMLQDITPEAARAQIEVARLTHAVPAGATVEVAKQTYAMPSLYETIRYFGSVLLVGGCIAGIVINPKELGLPLGLAIAAIMGTNPKFIESFRKKP